LPTKNSVKSPPQKDTSSKTSSKWWVRGNAEACEFFEISSRTLSEWEKRGAPKEGYGKWDIKKLIEWKNGAGSKDGDKSPEIRKITAEADWKESKAAQEAIKLAVTEGRYIATEEVAADLKRLFMVLKKSFLAMGHNIAIELNSLDPESALVAKKVVDNVVYNALDQIAENGEYVQRKK